ncbi:serine/threonine-protein kinase [Myxococcota bacterium]|nr:serine/threonine-protein kinase [Myxococcota bacterium]
MPAVFGKYQMITRIASGGMAEVWLARSSSLGGFEKLLAIKRMHSTLSKNQSFVSMFIDEAKLTVSLNHPNIVQIFDFGVVDDDYFMAMEYVEGTDLANLAKRARKQEKPLPVDMCAYVMRGVFDGLAYAHTRTDRYGRAASIIHRDVSPQNVLVSYEGHVKVSDFGIARAAQKIEPARRGEIFGKVAYLSPEQSRGDAVTTATDVWAAGVILHELLTNRRLFLRDSDHETMVAVQESEIPRPSALNPDVPAALDDAVMYVLTRDPDKRPASAREVAELLAEILRKHFAGASEYRLRDVISALWDHQPPRLLPAADEREDTRDARPQTGLEKTLPVSERTAAEIAAVARRQRPLGDARVWSEPDRPAVTRRATVTRAELGSASIGDLVDAAPETELVASAALPIALDPLSLEVQHLKTRFVTDPNLWTIVDIGRAYAKAGKIDRALAAYKIAAAKFAQRGLLVQAAAIYTQVLEVTELSEAVKDEIRRLRTLQGMADEEVLRQVFDPADDTADFSEYEGVLSTSHEPVDVYAESPILSSLSSEQLVGLVQALRPRHHAMGDTIIREGERGEAFFMIARGRVVVSTTNFASQKIYVTSLSDGDCFGEHGFFTGEPRTATVEALEDVLVLEVSKEVLNRMIQEYPTVRESLRRFYKERIAESLLAKSPLFGHLSITARKMFSERFTFETYEPGDLIIREGDQSDAFYAIKTGRVLVYTGGEELPIKLAELGPGDVFGEIAAVEGRVRTASVRALEDCEILRLEAGELNALLARHIDIRRLIADKIEERAEGRIRRIIEST